MANVVSIHGSPIQAREPARDVVETLEAYLQMARDGQIRGVAFVFVSADDSVTTGWSGGDADSRILLSGASTLQYRIAKQLDED